MHHPRLRDPVRDGRLSPDLSGQIGSHDRALHARRSTGRTRTPTGSASDRIHGTAICRRKPARCRRHLRGRNVGKIPPGRLCDVLLGHPAIGHQSVHVQQTALRSGQGLCARNAGRIHPLVHRRAILTQHKHTSRTRHLRQGQSWKTHLRFGRNRQHPPHHHGIAQGGAGPGHRARALQGHRPGCARVHRRRSVARRVRLPRACSPR